MARDIGKTDAYVVSRRRRKKVEMLFARLYRGPVLRHSAEPIQAANFRLAVAF